MKSVADGGFEADDQRFGVLAALGAVLGGVQHRRMHAEMESLIVERGDGVADYLVGQFANGFAHQFIGFGQFGAGELAGHAHRGFRIEIEDDSCLRCRR